MGKGSRERFLFGVVCALAGGALWGFSGACSQYLFAHYDIDASFITAARMLGSGALFLVLLLATRRERLVAMLRDRASFRRLVIFGVFGLFACQFSYIASIGCTNAGTATVLQSLGTVWVMLAACALAKKPPRAGEALGLVLALAATFLIATQGDPSSPALPAAGLAWGLVNSLTVAIYIMYPNVSCSCGGTFFGRRALAWQSGALPRESRGRHLPCGAVPSSCLHSMRRAGSSLPSSPFWERSRPSRCICTASRSWVPAGRAACWRHGSWQSATVFAALWLDFVHRLRLGRLFAHGVDDPARLRSGRKEKSTARR